MKRIWKSAAYMVLITMIGCEVPMSSSGQTDPINMLNPSVAAQQQFANPQDSPDPDQPETGKKKIKVALLLDTSGSMSGLIEQAKNQLWKIITQLAKAKDPDGNDPEIEIALYQYGNDGLSVYDGYVQKISGFTSELDEISEKLFALRTNGGSEYCGTVINASIEQLNWSVNQGDLQLIFIAGNEPFTQGFYDYKAACGKAALNDVIVNTVYCGDFNEGASTFWKDGAIIGQGKYMNINHESRIVHYDSPYDRQIVQLNVQLNNTYIPYGSMGSLKKQKQVQEDANAQSYGYSVAAMRSASKGSKAYKNSRWDLVDKSDEKDFKISEIDAEHLPQEMKSMSEPERKAYIENKKAERTVIQQQINELNKKREAFVAQKKKEAGVGDSQLEDAMLQAIVDQAQRKNYSFSNSIN